MDDAFSFGRWLQQRRKLLDLTQAELGQQVGVSGDAIRKIEGDERRPSKEVAEHLAQLLHIPLEERTAFVRFARGEAAGGLFTLPPLAETAPWRPTARPPSNLPLASTSFIGREHEVAVVCALVRRSDVRLLTLTGPGGIGKTRLGLQVSEAMRDEFPDGIWFVGLAAITEPGLVAATIATTLRVKEISGQSVEATLQEYLRDKHMVLLLDNFEHVVRATPLIPTLLSQALHLKVLVTSRVSLHLSGEQEFPVPSLTLPQRQPLPHLEALSQYEAVDLFIKRAQGVKPEFQLTPATAAAVAEICCRLDGLPLAIELAAVRSKVLMPTALLQRLDQRLKLLTGGSRDLPARHHTLRSTIEWSYQLLAPTEQTIFHRLAIFVGGWTLEAAESVCALADDLPVSILDIVQALVDQSLVRQEEGPDGNVRFGMLETIREYALERLELSGEMDQVHEAHADFYLRFAERTEQTADVSLGAGWAEPLKGEQPNIRTALQWCLQTGARDTALRFVIALISFWHFFGYSSEGRRWCELVLADGSDVSPSLLMEARNQAAYLASEHGYLAAAQRWLEDNLVLSRQLGNEYETYGTLLYLGFVLVRAEKYEQAAICFEEGLVIAQTLGIKHGIASHLHGLGVVALNQGDVHAARRHIEQAVALTREVDHTYSHRKYNLAGQVMELGRVAMYEGALDDARTHCAEAVRLAREVESVPVVCEALVEMGRVELLAGELDIARQHFAASLSLWQDADNPIRISENLWGLGGVAGRQGQIVRAARLFGAEAALRTSINEQPDRVDRELYEQLVTSIRSQADASVWEAAWTEGQEMTVDEAISYAFEDVDTTLDSGMALQ